MRWWWSSWSHSYAQASSIGSRVRNTRIRTWRRAPSTSSCEPLHKTTPKAASIWMPLTLVTTNNLCQLCLPIISSILLPISGPFLQNVLTSISMGRVDLVAKRFNNGRPGWINDENPYEVCVKNAERNWQTPIDEIDAMARVLDPVC